VPQKTRLVEKSRRQRHPSLAWASAVATSDWRAQQPDPVDELPNPPTATSPSEGHGWADAEASEQVVDDLLWGEKDSVENDLDDAWTDTPDSEAQQARTFTPDSDDLVRRYLLEIGAYKRLTFAEEVALAKKIEEGRQAGKRKPPAGVSHLRAKAADNSAVAETRWTEELDSDAARAHMIRANLRLVVSIAKQFAGRGLSLLDLIQEGNLGLMKAVERFDWRRGCRFGTYASWWIKQSIGRAISDQGRMIRLPAHMADSISRVYRLRQSWLQMHEAEPTAEELSKVAGVTRERIERIDQLTTPPVSIDWLLSDGDRSVGDLLPDDSDIPPIDRLLEHERDSLLHGSLRDLTLRERRVLRMHFGIGQRRAYTLEEIGRQFQLTRERIRQIELKALQKLRHPSRRRLLEEVMAATALPEKSIRGGEISVDDGC
jgi:RNA polymerase primary sigma factor